MRVSCFAVSVLFSPPAPSRSAHCTVAALIAPASVRWTWMIHFCLPASLGVDPFTFVFCGASPARTWELETPHLSDFPPVTLDGLSHEETYMLQVSHLRR